jgi:hypothetical protein
MSLAFYKILHYISIMGLFTSLGALSLAALNANGREFPHRKIFTNAHGVSLFFVLLSGFGQLARLGLTSGFPLWVTLKIVFWLILGGSIAIILRKPQLNRYLWLLWIIFGGLSAYLGHLKPFTN